MNERIHDDEPDTSKSVVCALLEAECPQWAGSPPEYLTTSGTSNAMWRVRCVDEPDVVVRLPRRPEAAVAVLQEVKVLRLVEHQDVASMFATPTVRHVGEPNSAFPHHWSVLQWIDGSDAWVRRDELAAGPQGALADDLARSVLAIRSIETDIVVPRAPGSRGGPLRPLLNQLDDWLTDPSWGAEALIDVDAVKRLADRSLEVADEPVTATFVHGDLIPGNLLVDGRRLAAIIDWGGTGLGDPAQDLAPAWAVLPASARDQFREMVGADDAAWLRGRAFELEHAVGGVLYYVPKKHPLGDVMARTLHRLLNES